jgi:hypothetical protein
VIDQSARKKVLLTSLFDRKRYKATDIADCYTRRWQIETSYRELKQTMLGMALTLRSRTVDGVYPEIWGALTAYNLIRLEMAKTALEVTCEPTEISLALSEPSTSFSTNFAGRQLHAPKANCHLYSNDCVSGSSPSLTKNGPVESSTGP